MPSITIVSDPSKNRNNNYTRVTVRMPQIGKVPIPWEFLRRQRNMVSLTIIGCTVWENIGPAAGQPLPVFAKVKRLHLDACSQAVVALMARTAPNVEHIEIIRSMPVVDLVNGHVKTISLRECTGLFAFHANCKMLTTIYVPDALPILNIITLRHCYRLQRIPNHFRYGEPKQKKKNTVAIRLGRRHVHLSDVVNLAIFLLTVPALAWTRHQVRKKRETKLFVKLKNI